MEKDCNPEDVRLWTNRPSIWHDCRSSFHGPGSRSWFEFRRRSGEASFFCHRKEFRRTSSNRTWNAWSVRCDASGNEPVSNASADEWPISHASSDKRKLCAASNDEWAVQQWRPSCSTSTTSSDDARDAPADVDAGSDRAGTTTSSRRAATSASSENG